MQGTYLMNGYSVFNVHVGMNPTLTYRTVLAKKRNTHFEKIKKIFQKTKNSSLTAVNEPQYIHIFTSSPRNGQKNKRSTTIQS